MIMIFITCVLIPLILVPILSILLVILISKIKLEDEEDGDNF